MEDERTLGIDDEQVTTAPRVRVFRSSEQRWLGGVCAGLAPVRGAGPGWIRLAFVLAALCAGLGVVVYLACWLIIPSDDSANGRSGPSGLVILAWATGGVVLLGLLALLSAIATVFGLGWVVFVVAAAVVASQVVPRLPLRPLWTLPIVAALTLPSVAVALSPVRLAVQSGTSVVAPASAGQLERSTYRTGFGTLLVDLRHTRMPASGGMTVRIDAGVRRTIVALPDSRCVRVAVHYTIHPFARQLASLLTGTAATADYGVVLFGGWHGGIAPSGTSGFVVAPARKTGPYLTIDFSSQGGSLYVRDYPDYVSPQLSPNWPGFWVTPEPRPNLRGEPPRAKALMLRNWRARLLVEKAQVRSVNSLIPGPCNPPATPAAGPTGRSREHR
jgi:phage shock protein PspC (stress-responsive transcriptional regulator)